MGLECFPRFICPHTPRYYLCSPITCDTREWLHSVSTFNTISPLPHIPMTYSCINWVGRTCISCPYLPLSFLTFPGKMVKKVNGWAIWRAWQSVEKWYTKNEEKISLLAPKHLIWDIIEMPSWRRHPPPSTTETVYQQQVWESRAAAAACSAPSVILASLSWQLPRSRSAR